MMSTRNPGLLIEADDSVLVVIDVQDVFLSKLPPQESERLLGRICWLVRVAIWKSVPLLVTAEERNGQPLARQLADVLPRDTAVFDKAHFGLAGQPDILGPLQAMRRMTAVLVGLETDVCVMQSALGLLERGYRVAVVADATGAPSPGQELGLDRMQSSGAIIASTKGVFYEWLRTIDEVKRFHRELPDMRGLAGMML